MLLLAVLREDPHAPEGPLLAGDVQGRVSSEVPDLGVASSLQQRLGNFRLICDHRQVEWSLQIESESSTVGGKTNKETPRIRIGPEGPNSERASS